MTDLRERLAEAVGASQNVPFVGPNQRRIADSMLLVLDEWLAGGEAWEVVVHLLNDDDVLMARPILEALRALAKSAS